MITAERVQKHLDDNIIPLLKQYGATVVSCDPAAHLKVDDFMRFIVMTIEFRGEKLELDGGAINSPPNLQWFFENYDELQDVVKAFDKCSDPFHSDIYREMRSRWGRNHKTVFAYSYICERLRQQGKRVWTE